MNMIKTEALAKAIHDHEHPQDDGQLVAPWKEQTQEEYKDRYRRAAMAAGAVLWGDLLYAERNVSEPISVSP